MEEVGGVTLEDDLKEISLNQKTELEGVAKELFRDEKDSESDQKTNIEPEELGLCLINDIVFDNIGMPELSPTKQFKRLASSRKGWKTEAFVRIGQGTMDMRSGGGFGQRFMSLFQRKE